MAATVRIGTSGWAYRDWVGPFYPEGTAAGDYLALYAERFGVVEVDSTFYGIPRRSTVERWAQKTPEGFLLAPKVPGAVTHGASGERPDVDRVLRDDAGDLESFLETLEPLGEKLGPVVFQFPYFRAGTLDPGDFRDRLAGTLDRLPEGMRAAVEIRNKTWVTSEHLALLRERGVGAVMVDHPYMPPPLHQLRVGMATADFAYIRLLGDRHAIEKVTTTWEKTVVERSGRLDDWAEVIARLGGRVGMREVYAFSNNHFAGHGPATCRELAERVSRTLAGG